MDTKTIRILHRVGGENRNIQLPLSEIVRLQGLANYARIFVKSGEQFVMSKTLRAYEDLLPAAQFYRIHKCHIVRLSEIASISERPNRLGAVVLKSGLVLPVSRTRKRAFWSAVETMKALPININP